jgi:branched-chain amino acid aminotransferase
LVIVYTFHHNSYKLHFITETMEETKFIWFNGKLVKWEDAKIHVLSHALHYGSGVFEGIRAYKTKKGPAVFRLKEHVKRLFSSAESLFMVLKYSQEDIIKAIKETVKSNGLEEGYIRPIIFYGYGKMGLNPNGADIDVAIAVWPWGSYIGESAKVKISNIMRIDPKSLKADKKVCGHYVNSILASLEAKKQGYDEAILLDSKGNVAEGPGENVFIIKDKKIFTPTLNHQILPGITRDSIIKIAKDLGYEVIEKDIKVSELKEADEIFFTGTAAEVTPISKLDNKEIGIGPITLKLKEKYMDIVRGKAGYEEWRDYV